MQTSATYSADGSQLMSQNDSNGYTTSYTYDAQRNLLTSTDNAGTQTNTNYYNENDRPSMTFQSGVVSTHFYYSCGMLTSVVRGGYISGNSTKQEQTYSMAYDGFGNMTSIAVGDRTLATYSYGSRNGNLSSMTYGNGAQVRYEYDNLDRVTAEYWNDTLKYRYYYNAEGALVKKLDVGTGKAVNYEYDSLGRLIHSQQSEDGTVIQRTEHIYDTENRIASQSWQMGDTTYSQTYTYRESDGALTYIDMSPDTDMALEYDSLKRLSSRYNAFFRENYTYRDIDANRTTTQVAALAFVKRPGGESLQEFSLNYGYDRVGNISSVSSTVRTDQNATYTYDQQGQLLTENSYAGSWTYAYDTYGNIRSATNGTTTHTYTYGDDEWLDLLTAYDGQSITYDAIGNPTSYYNGTRWTFTWQNGRQLASASKSGTSVSFTYDVGGIRDSKTVGSTTYQYVTQNGQVVRQTWGSHTLDIIYDNNSRPWAMFYDGTKYFYQLNLQGDVIGIVDTTGASVAKYAYDAWGRVVYSTGTMAAINPIRYRGYYYDAELGMYYLQSRYYDPALKRFINADSYASTGQKFLGQNMFAYCCNRPIMYSDPDGQIAILPVSILAFMMIALTSCSTQKNPKTAPNNNCYAYALGVNVNCAIDPGYAYLGSRNSSLHNEVIKKNISLDTLASYVLEDCAMLGYDAKIIEDPDDIQEGYTLIAMKITGDEFTKESEYHFAVLMDDGNWTDKPGSSSAVRVGEIDGFADTWTIGNYVYDSETRYFAIRRDG